MSYASSNTAVATVLGDIVTIIGVGSTNITASQSGDVDNVAATNVVQGLTVTVTPAITIANSGSTLTSTLTTSPSCDITIPSGGTLTVDEAKTIRNVTVAAGGKLNLSNPLTVVGNVTLKDDVTGSFSVNLGDFGLAVTGTVRYFKTMNNTRWYFVAFPCDVTVASITQSDASSLGTLGVDWFIKYYDGDTRTSNLGVSSNWKNISLQADPTKLLANKGYIVGVKDGIGPFEFYFPLTNAIVSSEPARNYSITAWGKNLSIADNHKGWNLVGQPYLSKYDLRGVNATYMTRWSGSAYTQWSNADIANLDPFEAYFVQADQSLETSGMTFLLANRQLAPSSVSNDSKCSVQLNLTTPTGNDRTTLILDKTESLAYQIGHDFEKWITTGSSNPQLYTNLNGVNYSFNSLPLECVHNLPLGIYSKSACPSNISVDASQIKGLGQLLLTDSLTGVVTDLLNSDYIFVASAGLNNSRFFITAQPVSNATSVPEVGFTFPKLTAFNNKLLVSDISKKTIIYVYDMLGHLIVNIETLNNSLEIPLPESGVYAVYLQVGDKNSFHSLINCLKR